MFRRNYRNFELEAFRAKEGGYAVQIMRRGSVVHTIREDEKDQDTFNDPDSALDAAAAWVDRNFMKARPRFEGQVS
jgi:hypothetical protein